MTKKKENRFEITWWLFKCSKMKSHNAIFQKNTMMYCLCLCLCLTSKDPVYLVLLSLSLAGRLEHLLMVTIKAVFSKLYFTYKTKLSKTFIRGCITQEKCEKNCYHREKEPPTQLKNILIFFIINIHHNHHRHNYQYQRRRHREEKPPQFASIFIVLVIQIHVCLARFRDLLRVRALRKHLL